MTIKIFHDIVNAFGNVLNKKEKNKIKHKCYCGCCVSHDTMFCGNIDAFYQDYLMNRKFGHTLF